MKKGHSIRWMVLDDDPWAHIVLMDEAGEDIAELSLTREQLLAMLAAIKPPRLPESQRSQEEKSGGDKLSTT